MVLVKKYKFQVGLLLLSAAAAGSTFSYFTSYDAKSNVMAVGHNTTEIEEDFPNPTPESIDDNPKYRKKVWVSNYASGEDGFNVECYVRVSLGFSNADIGSAVVLENLDAVNWKYDPTDGYYYYLYKISEGESTSPLFTGVSIQSESVDMTYIDKISDFEIQVYEESVEAEGFDHYVDAWNYYKNPI